MSVRQLAVAVLIHHSGVLGAMTPPSENPPSQTEAATIEDTPTQPEDISLATVKKFVWHPTPRIEVPVDEIRAQELTDAGEYVTDSTHVMTQEQAFAYIKRLYNRGRSIREDKGGFARTRRTKTKQERLEDEERVHDMRIDAEGTRLLRQRFNVEDGIDCEDRSCDGDIG